MIAEGMVEEGLAITRMVHDRYHPSRRNPWNEIECGDHYSRAMASYGVFLSACGYRYHGPKGHLGFAPRFGAEDFRAAYTAADGWGSYSQKVDEDQQFHTIELRWGHLKLNSLGFELDSGIRGDTVAVMKNGHEIRAESTAAGGQTVINLAEEVNLVAGDTLRITLG
jgi:hypothetical protein